MIKNRLILENFNKKYLRHKHSSYLYRLKIYDELLKEAQAFKKIPLRNPLEGIEACLRIAAILNSLK